MKPICALIVCEKIKEQKHIGIDCLEQNVAQSEHKPLLKFNAVALVFTCDVDCVPFLLSHCHAGVGTGRRHGDQRLNEQLSIMHTQRFACTTVAAARQQPR
jgi:hypothetical protein